MKTIGKQNPLLVPDTPGVQIPPPDEPKNTASESVKPAAAGVCHRCGKPGMTLLFMQGIEIWRCSVCLATRDRSDMALNDYDAPTMAKVLDQLSAERESRRWAELCRDSLASVNKIRALEVNRDRLQTEIKRLGSNLKNTAERSGQYWDSIQKLEKENEDLKAELEGKKQALERHAKRLEFSRHF